MVNHIAEAVYPRPLPRSGFKAPDQVQGPR